ncbi:hypothetical protein CPB86DRAFT_751874 [Serendipita vermifera]|nr:hypothetical protein CPB86DRAFT_751874 [Serendipita vermifera]
MQLVSILLLFLSLFLRLCLASRPLAVRNDAASSQSFQCHPFGVCEPCPDDSLHEPFCQPFGNRRLMHCLPSNTTTTTPHGPGSHPILGEIPAWETCGRIVGQETADFWEFVLCMGALSLVSLFILYTRSRRVTALRRRALVARIGIHRPW